jgi:hypothetical protein
MKPHGPIVKQISEILSVLVSRDEPLMSEDLPHLSTSKKELI